MIKLVSYLVLLGGFSFRFWKVGNQCSFVGFLLKFAKQTSNQFRHY